ncbi:MAG: LysR family transcriptional regulator [Clostridia bacterium]|nr:LysR family transcriptional regulator [Clostridia bacterium]
MTLQQLSYFVSACRHGNISRAAEEHSVSQPSVSAAIKSLEREFGVALIERRRIGFVLTGDGEEFRELAEALIHHAECVRKAMEEKGNRHSLLRLGVPPMVGSVLFPAIYADFSQRREDVSIFTREMGREDLLNALEEGSLDLAFLPHRAAFPKRYEAIPVTDFEMVCCVPPSHPLATEKSVTAKRLEAEPLISFSRGFYHAERINSFFQAAGVKPNVIHTSSQLSTVERFVMDGMAIGFLFRPLTEKNASLVPVSLDPPIVTHISLVFRKDLLRTEAINSFLQYIKNHYPSPK